MSQSLAQKIVIHTKRQMAPRNIFFLLFNIVVFVTYYTHIRDVGALSFSSELYSHIVLIPLVSGYFIYLARKKIFSDIGYSFNTGIILIAFGILLYFIGITQGGGFNQNDYLSLITLSLVMLWIGGFVFLYGTQSFRQASFPLLFLVFMIPIPNLLTDNIIYLLQIASAEVSYGFFRLTGVPIYREGFLFHLPGLSVEVAKECSGIRSSIALFITSILAGHLFLKTGWKKVILSLSIFPITILKNGVRIVTLSLLGAYVDKSLLTDSLLHRRGGIPFFILALAFLAPILWLLRKSERRGSEGVT